LSIEDKPNFLTSVVRFIGRFLPGIRVNREINEEIAKTIISCLKSSIDQEDRPEMQVLRQLIPNKWRDSQEEAVPPNLPEQVPLVDVKDMNDAVGKESLPHEGVDRFNVAFEAAQRGNPESMYDLAWCYSEGIGCDQNSTQALSWMEKAVCKGAFGAHVGYSALLGGVRSMSELGRRDEIMELPGFPFELCRCRIKEGFVPAFQGALSIDEEEKFPLENIPPGCDVRGSPRVGESNLGRYEFYITSKFPNVFAVPPCYPESLSAMLNKLTDIDIFRDQKAIVCPLYMGKGGGAHVTLVYIDREKRTVEYFDSLKNYGDLFDVEEKLCEITAALSAKDPGKGYAFIPKINKPLQRDGSSCGVYTLFFLEKRLHEPNFEFHSLDPEETQDAIQEYRAKMTGKLVAMKKNKELDERLMSMNF
jgi:hypothetical protein